MTKREARLIAKEYIGSHWLALGNNFWFHNEALKEKGAGYNLHDSSKIIKEIEEMLIKMRDEARSKGVDSIKEKNQKSD